MNLIFKMADAARVMLQSGKGLGGLLRNGASVASTQIMHNCGHYISQLNTIIDVGANKGQFALAAAYKFPHAKVLSFEPLPDAYKSLQQNTRKSARISAFNYALGSNDGQLAFYSNEYSHASSALQVSETLIALEPGTANAVLTQVPVKRLDTVLQQLPVNGPVLLKMDVQGFEKEVLSGAGNSLQQIDYLLFETSFVPLYKGEPLFDEMHHFVKSLGFEFIAPVGFLQSGKLQILQMDLLYKKR
ncbi:FkbM family methyltransferase [Chitinophaga sp. Cy-1792]|uniref:FkbM family methyltransferase n=1 Tax=Chitinophaga sp. Cy-1792 TaxID=2608339 RepID=UPI001422C582|nr:FkbM family methyltransferase [Chitinophaga sp. Cy-1792]NIG54436.1 FkbM family methyltransferase [Chitinophaga sp. Cy-1792]